MRCAGRKRTPPARRNGTRKRPAPRSHSILHLVSTFRSTPKVHLLSPDAAKRPNSAPAKVSLDPVCLLSLAVAAPSVVIPSPHPFAAAPIPFPRAAGRLRSSSLPFDFAPPIRRRPARHGRRPLLRRPSRAPASPPDPAARLLIPSLPRASSVPLLEPPSFSPLPDFSTALIPLPHFHVRTASRARRPPTASLFPLATLVPAHLLPFASWWPGLLPFLRSRLERSVRLRPPSSLPRSRPHPT